MAFPANNPCPCTSGQKYKRCCRPLHLGDPAASPEALVRSRFSAYALGLVDYVMDTTDSLGPQARPNRSAWAGELLAYCAGMQFSSLEIQGASIDGDTGTVRFEARLRRNAQATGMHERHLENSRFVRRKGRWLYTSGEIENES